MDAWRSFLAGRWKVAAQREWASRAAQHGRRNAGDSPELSGGAAREFDSGGGRRPAGGESREVGARRSEWGTEEVGFV
jgi:hypothetical protein